LELSPNSVLFAANVSNPNLTCNGIVDSLLSCSLFRYKAVKSDPNAWWGGSIQIPFTLLRSLPFAFHVDGKVNNVLVANFFRVDTPKGKDQEFSCWNCDYSNPACFHMPYYFRRIILS